MNKKLLLFLFPLLLSACSISSKLKAPDPCSPPEIIKNLDPIKEIDHKFDDAYKLASNTPRISLSLVISDLQGIRREAEQLEVPSCAVRTKEALIAYMDKAIEGFLQFMSNDIDYVSTFSEAQTMEYSYWDEYRTLIQL